MTLDNLVIIAKGYCDLYYRDLVVYNFLKDRECVILLLDNMIDIYYSILKDKMFNDNNLLNYSDNSVNKIIFKIDFLNSVRDKVKYNININLLLDNIVVNIGGA